MLWYGYMSASVLCVINIDEFDESGTGQKLIRAYVSLFYCHAVLK